MKAVVVYESMYGNTHLVADAIARGLAPVGEVVVVPVGDAGAESLAGADLVVVGGPTHVHGMTRSATRKAAVEAAAKPGTDLELEPDAEGPGLREWFTSVRGLPPKGAAFDTRMAGSPAVTGRASKGIAKRLRQHGCTLLDEPTSFLVTKDTHLEADEVAHAEAWGGALASVALEGAE